MRRSLIINRRGLNQIISMVLIILVVLAAIVVLYYFINGLLNDSGERVEFESLYVDTALSVKKESVVLDEENKILSLTVERVSGQEDLAGLSIVVWDDTGKSITREFNELVKAYESKNLRIDLGGSGLSNVARIDAYYFSFDQDEKFVGRSYYTLNLDTPLGNIDELNTGEGSNNGGSTGGSGGGGGSGGSGGGSSTGSGEGSGGGIAINPGEVFDDGIAACHDSDSNSGDVNAQSKVEGFILYSYSLCHLEEYSNDPNCEFTLSSSDWCKDSSSVYEKTCVNNDIVDVIISCANGCSSGKCL